MKPAAWWVLIVIAGLSAQPLAGSGRSVAPIACPAEIAPDAISKVSAPMGWKASVRGPILLHGVDVTMGPPENLVILKPSDASTHGKGVDVWTGLRQRVRGTDGAWLACTYGDSDTLVLAKRLDPRINECRATYTSDEQGGFNVDILCK